MKEIVALKALLTDLNKNHRTNFDLTGNFSSPVTIKLNNRIINNDKINSTSSYT